MKTFYLFCILFHFGVNAQTVENADIQLSVADYNHNPIANDKVIFVGKKSKQTYSVITEKNGKAKISLPSGEIYDIKIDALGDALEYNTLEIPSIPAGYAFAEMQLIIEYHLPEMVTLNGLNFETGKSQIRPESISQLNELADYLLRKENMSIAISGHTDDDGDPNKNLVLSQQRADSVKKYLVDQGVAESRMKTKGYGSSKPVADNANAEGKAKNRRTEIKVITK